MGRRCYMGRGHWSLFLLSRGDIAVPMSVLWTVVQEKQCLQPVSRFALGRQRGTVGMALSAATVFLHTRKECWSLHGCSRPPLCSDCYSSFDNEAALPSWPRSAHRVLSSSAVRQAVCICLSCFLLICPAFHLVKIQDIVLWPGTWTILRRKDSFLLRMFLGGFCFVFVVFVVLLFCFFLAFSLFHHR